MSKTKTINYTANDRTIVAALKDADHPMTLAEINEKAHLNLKAGSITSAVRKGLVTKVGETKVKRPTKHKVSTYSFVTAEVLTEVRHDGSAPKPYNYTPSETAILATASTMPHQDKPFTLAELSAAHGAEVKSGNINSLLYKGNLAKVGTRIVDAWTYTKVSTYAFAADVPSDEAVPENNAADDRNKAETTQNA